MAKKEMDDERFESMLDFFDKVFRDPEKYPGRAVVLPMRGPEITRAFTPKRLELVELIKRDQPTTAAKLAKVTGRMVEGVLRDLALLKELHIVQHRKEGKEVVLTMKQDFLVIPLVPSLALKELKQKHGEKSEGELNEEAKKDIEAARKQIKGGKGISTKELVEQLGL